MSNISSFIDLNSNKFMTIKFTKKDGTQRTINGRLNVTKHLAGGKRTLDDSFIIIYSMADKGYRAVNKDTIKSVKIDGVTITV